ncbi:MAG: hypothetical protein JXQ23_05000 [Clostridia bacterium]|nr:hypothetical protein [Clostridia bacterium]
MNSRERLLKCIKNEPIDRVPISTYEMVPFKAKNDFYNLEPSYQNMMDFFAKYTDIIYSAAPEMTPLTNITERIETPIEGGVMAKIIIHGRGKDLVKVQKKLDNQYTWWTLKHFCDDMDDLEVYIDTLPDLLEEVSLDQAHQLEKDLGDKGIMMLSIPDPLCIVADSFEFGNFLVQAITETERIYKAADAIYEYQTYHFDKMIKAGIDNMMIRIYGPEYATPPYLPPSMYPDLVTKYLVPMSRKIKEANGFTRVHCHGKTAKVLDQFLMSDMIALEPIEPIPDGDISIGEIKKICGDRVCLMGSLELKELENADTSRINMLVRETMDMAKGKSGLIMMPTASPINAPLSKKTEENYHEFVNASLQYGKY